MGTANSATQRLREAIWPLHDLVERHSPLALVARGRATREQYVQALERLYGFIVPLEEGLRRYGASQADAGGVSGLPASMSWSRAGLLRRDLLALGVGEPALRGLPLCAALPRITGPEEALGHLYLTQGSRLGGKVIASAVGQSLGLGPATGCAYFSGDGEDAGTHWSAFKALVESGVGPGREAAMIEAARGCFLAMLEWFREAGA